MDVDWFTAWRSAPKRICGHLPNGFLRWESSILTIDWTCMPSKKAHILKSASPRLYPQVQNTRSQPLLPSNPSTASPHIKLSKKRIPDHHSSTSLLPTALRSADDFASFQETSLKVNGLLSTKEVKSGPPVKSMPDVEAHNHHFTKPHSSELQPILSSKSPKSSKKAELIFSKYRKTQGKLAQPRSWEKGERSSHIPGSPRRRKLKNENSQGKEGEGIRWSYQGKDTDLDALEQLHREEIARYANVAKKSELERLKKIQEIQRQKLINKLDSLEPPPECCPPKKVMTERVITEKHVGEKKTSGNTPNSRTTKADQALSKGKPRELPSHFASKVASPKRANGKAGWKATDSKMKPGEVRARLGSPQMKNIVRSKLSDNKGSRPDFQKDRAHPKKDKGWDMKRSANFEPRMLARTSGVHTEGIYEDKNPFLTAEEITVTSAGLALPQALDYKEQGMVTAAGNQLLCGCCWAFTAIAVYESFLLRSGLPRFDLSEEYVLECTSSLARTGEADCGGSDLFTPAYVLAAQGAPLESKFPYRAGKYGIRSGTPVTPGLCSASFLVRPKALKAVKLKVQSDGDMKAALVKYGPVVVGFYASSAFSKYTGGPFFDGSCVSPPPNNHAVVVYGYDSNGNWLVKNSWGRNWGDAGFMKLVGAANCGIFRDVIALVSS